MGSRVANNLSSASNCEPVSALGENVENERGAVQHLAIEDAFEVAALRGGQFVVEDDGVHVIATALLREFVRLAGADEGAGNGRIHFLSAIADDFASGSGGQLGKFVEGFACVEGAA